MYSLIIRNPKLISKTKMADQQSLTDHLLASATGHFEWPANAVLYHLPKGQHDICKHFMIKINKGVVFIREGVAARHFTAVDVSSVSENC